MESDSLVGLPIFVAEPLKPRRSKCQPAKSLLTPADVRSLGLFFKALLESKRLTALAAIAACGSILGGLHVLWLAIRWLARF